MTDLGDICAADLGEEALRRVLVLSNASFHRRSGRVLVAPEWPIPDVLVPHPWVVEADDGVRFSVDYMRSVESDRLVSAVGRAPYRTVAAARRALLAIT